MGLPLLESFASSSKQPFVLPRKQALALVLAVFFIIGGRQIRTHMLLDDQGLWKEAMWLDQLVLPAKANAAGRSQKSRKPKLTTPLPINTCSADSLTLLPGVGKVMAGRIDAARQQGQVFTCAADLQKIKGIGTKLSARLDTLVIYQIERNPTNLNPDSVIFDVSP